MDPAGRGFHGPLSSCRRSLHVLDPAAEDRVISLDTNIIQLLVYANIHKDETNTIARKKHLACLEEEDMTDEQLTRLFEKCAELDDKLSGKAVVGATACHEYYNAPPVSIL